MTIPRGDGSEGRRVSLTNSCLVDEQNEITPNPAQESLETIETSVVAPLEVVEVVDTSAMRVFFRCRSRALRFFVSSPGIHPSCSSVGFINQANRTLLECHAEATHLYSLLGHSIEVVYNPTISGWSSRNVSSETRIVRLLREGWDAYFSRVRCSGVLRLQYCAGDGTLVVRSALQGYPHAQRIVVITIAPSCTIDPALCFRISHYRAEGDLTSVCCGFGSAYSEFAVLSRHGQSRGAFDSNFHSSTFMELIRLEGLCFHLRQELIRAGRSTGIYDNELEDLRAWCAGQGYFRPGDRLNAMIPWEIRRHLVDFLRRHGGDGLVPFLGNLIERALDECPCNDLGQAAARMDMFRDLLIIAAEISLLILVNRSDFMHLAALGVPILQAVILLREVCLFSIPRRQESAPRLRRWALRGYLLTIVCLLYESGIICSFAISDNTRDFLLAGFVGCFAVTGLIVLCESIISLYSPLRGRIQGLLAVVREDDIETIRSENEGAQRLGDIQRLLRICSQLGRGVLAGIVMGSVIYPIVCHLSGSDSMFPEGQENATALFRSNISGSDSMFPEGQENATALSTSNTVAAGAVMGLLGLSVAAAVISIKNNICLMRQILNRFGRERNVRREGPIIEEIPLVEIEPITEVRSEGTSLVGIEPSDGGRRGGRLLELLTDPNIRETGV